MQLPVLIFNGDGKADLIAANYTSNNLSVLLGDGTGNFSPAANFSAGTGTRSVISADFNGDGKIDIAAANYTSNNISVLLGDGAGNLGSSTNFTVAVGANPISIVSGDFNGDGKADLATANYSTNNVSVFLGTGTGSFGTVKNFAVSTNSNPQALISADFNNDGKVDLATANSNANNESVLIGNGAGSFGSSIAIPVNTTANSVISADFNGDGKTDLATANSNASNVSVALSTAISSYTTSAAINFFADDQPQSIISADFNGDGKADLAVANYNTNDISIILNSTTTLQITGKNSVCPGASTVLYASGANTYLWHPTNTLNDSIGSFETASPIATTNYTVTGIYGTNCMNTNTITVTVYPTPTITIHMIAGDTCKNATSPLTASGANTYVWTSLTNTTTTTYTGTTYVVSPTVTTTYSVTGTDTNGCQNTTNFVQVISKNCTTGIDQISNANQLIVYPNPSNGNFIVETNTIERQLVQLFDVTGKMILSQYINGKTTVDTGIIPDGIYNISITGNGGVMNKKLVIVR